MGHLARTKTGRQQKDQGYATPGIVEVPNVVYEYNVYSNKAV